MDTTKHPYTTSRRVTTGFITATCLILLTCTTATASTLFQEQLDEPEQSGHTPQIYIPLIDNSLTLRAASEPCTSSREAAGLIAMIQSHAAQERASLSCDPALSVVAAAKAQDMADRGYFAHVTPEGIGPNYQVRQAGFPLSTRYSTRIDANNIESIAVGTATPEQTLTLFLDSPGHRAHLLGESSFYHAQEHIGVGMVHAPDSDYRFYWVVIISEAETDNA